MKKIEWNEGLNHLDPDLIEKYVEQKDRLRQKNKKQKGIWLRIGAAAACFLLIIGAVIIVPNINNGPDIPITKVPSKAPQYYGNASSIGESEGNPTLLAPDGICVTAKFIEALPDVYTFFDDWNQNEYRLLRMQTVKLLQGQEMTEEFYYLIPVQYFTDFSVFDKFVIKDMIQFSYEYSVMYNKTQGTAEQLSLVIFGYNVYGHNYMGHNVMAFDADGSFDERLWKATEDWVKATQGSVIVVDTLENKEKEIQDRTPEWLSDLYVHLLKDISGEAAKVLEQIKSFDNGIYVQPFYKPLTHFSLKVQFDATRYINGFATNEKVSILSKEWNNLDKDTYTYTKARFTENDLKSLPDLPSAMASVTSSYNAGNITPPHITSYKEKELLNYGIFGWYAKTSGGVIGIIRVTWHYKYLTYDDAYYIVEYGSDECKPIDRDDLLEKLGDYETTYIYTGEYDENGKIRDAYTPVA